MLFYQERVVRGSTESRPPIEKFDAEVFLEGESPLEPYIMEILTARMLASGENIATLIFSSLAPREWIWSNAPSFAKPWRA